MSPHAASRERQAGAWHKLAARARRRGRHSLFDDRYAQADFGFWAKLAFWHPEEAAALSLGYDPDSVNACTVKVHHDTSEALNFHQRSIIVSRAVDANVLKKTFSPAEFVLWADGINLSIPRELREAVATIRVSVEVASGEVDQLRKQNKLLEDQCKDPHPRVLRSLQILIAGMAAGHYSFNPSAARSAATKAIADDIEKLGLSIDKDTVLTQLRAAFRDLEIDPSSS